MDKKEFWNERAVLGERAGTNDIIMKQLEQKELAKYFEEEDNILDFGCGNGATIVYLAKKFKKAKFVGIDFSDKMIEEARKAVQSEKLDDRVELRVLDHTELDGLPKKFFSKIYSERAIINLDDWKIQKKTILELMELLQDGGLYLMCESSLDGLNKINMFRKKLSLSEILPPWHNCYLEDKNIHELEQEKHIALKEVNHFSSTYYFLSRVINAKLASDKGEEPSYDSEINKLAYFLDPISDFGQGKIWVWQKLL